MGNTQIDPIPEIYCALAAICNSSSAPEGFEDQLKQLIGQQIAPQVSYDGKLCYKLVETGYIPSWEVDDVLTLMFHELDGKLKELKGIIQNYGCSLYIDVAFYQHGTYPALCFFGEVMKNIIFLEAEISIDPY
jgi:hypothetical protein